MKKATPKSPPQPQGAGDGILITSAKAIGSTLGGLAAIVGIAAPPVPPPARKKPTAKPKTKAAKAPAARKVAKTARPRKAVKQATSRKKKG
jgi:hypothetical protein